MAKSLTIHDIAKQAGVSATVVSRAINGREGKIPISAAVRERVLEIVRHTGYRPSAAARSLALGRTRTLLMVVESKSSAGGHDYGAAFSAGMVAAQRLRYKAYALFSAHGVDLAQYPVLRETTVDGVVVMGAVRTETLREFADRGIPLVYVNGLHEKPDDCVLADDRQGAQAAVGHLLGLGHREVAMIASHSPHPSMANRLGGYRRAHEEAGLPFRETHVFYSPEAFLSAMAIQSRPPFSAAFCYTDYEMLVILSGLAQRGLRIPDDISLVSCNDSGVARDILPAVTSVAVPFQEMAVAGVEMLVERIRTGGPLPSRTLPEQLIVRASARALSGADGGRLDVKDWVGAPAWHGRRTGWPAEPPHRKAVAARGRSGEEAAMSKVG